MNRTYTEWPPFLLEKAPPLLPSYPYPVSMNRASPLILKRRCWCSKVGHRQNSPGEPLTFC